MDNIFVDKAKKTRAIYNILNDDQGRKKNGDTTKLN
jgi:hypothetical protein